MAREPNDWRLNGQEDYLKGVTLSWRKYSRYSKEWEHDHCEFCWAKFMEQPGPEILTEGYTTPDKYRWICKTCFDDFRDLFDWKVV
jgi:phage terminase large subunit-like protein